MQVAAENPDDVANRRFQAHIGQLERELKAADLGDAAEAFLAVASTPCPPHPPPPTRLASHARLAAEPVLCGVLAATGREDNYAGREAHTTGETFELPADPVEAERRRFQVTAKASAEERLELVRQSRTIRKNLDQIAKLKKKNEAELDTDAKALLASEAGFLKEVRLLQKRIDIFSMQDRQQVDTRYNVISS